MNTAEKPFWDHLEELRDRALNCLRVLVATSVVGYMVRHPILDFLKRPLLEALPPDKQHLYFTGLFESFFNHLQIAVIAGIFIGSPYFLWQLWAFIGPGLRPHERRPVLPFIFFGTVFFFAGAAFAYWLVLPYGFKFFVEFGAPYDVPMITVKEYFSVLFRLLLLFGASFELPVVLVLLAHLGLVSSDFLVAHRKNALIVITVFSALFAPPDVVSMLLMMTPLYGFYEIAILAIRIIEKKKGATRSAG